MSRPSTGSTIRAAIELAASVVRGDNLHEIAGEVEPVSREFLLMPAHADAKVVIHVLPEDQKAYPDSSLQLAADWLIEMSGGWCGARGGI